MSAAANKSLSRLFSGANHLWSGGAQSGNVEYEVIATQDDEEKALHTSLLSPPAYDPAEVESGTVNDSDMPRKDKANWSRLDCCIICGVHISIRSYLIVFTIVVLLFIIGPYVKQTFWRNEDNTSVQLEGAPSFGDSLGCIDAPYILNDAENELYEIPVGEKGDHFLDVRGGSVGTVLLARGTGDRVTVTSTVRTDNKDLLDSVIIEQHDPALSTDSFWRIITPRPDNNTTCMRYDLTVHIPPNLKKLHLAAHAVAHIRFQNEIEGVGPDVPLDDLYVTFYSPSNRSLFLPTKYITAHHTFFEMTSGSMSGSFALLERGRIATQRGDARTHIEIYPIGNSSLGVAELQSVTGSGRSDFIYYRAAPTRQIDSNHISTAYGDMHLHYEHADFHGHVDVSAQSWKAEGLNDPQDSTDDNHGMPSVVLPWVGDRNGSDFLKARSDRGNVELHF